MSSSGSPDPSRLIAPASEPASEPAMTISGVTKRVGISEATLRAWESRYGLAPSRTTAGGHRRYTLADVERLRSVVQLIRDGVPAGEAARTVLATADPGFGLPRLDLPADVDRAAHQLADAALDLDGPTTRALLREQLARTGVPHTWECLLRPVLAAAGEQWPDVPHGIAVEHLLSHTATV